MKVRRLVGIYLAIVVSVGVSGCGAGSPSGDPTATTDPASGGYTDPSQLKKGAKIPDPLVSEVQVEEMEATPDPRVSYAGRMNKWDTHPQNVVLATHQSNEPAQWLSSVITFRPGEHYASNTAAPGVDDGVYLHSMGLSSSKPTIHDGKATLVDVTASCTAPPGLYIVSQGDDVLPNRKKPEYLVGYVRIAGPPEPSCSRH